MIDFTRKRTKFELRKMTTEKPVIDRRMLMGGMNKRNFRQEIKKFGCKLKDFEEEKIEEKPILKPIKSMFKI